MKIKDGTPVIDLSALSLVAQSKEYDTIRRRAIDNPNVAVKCRFRMNHVIREQVENWIHFNLDREFSLAC